MIDVYSLLKGHNAYIFANGEALVATTFGQDPSYLVVITIRYQEGENFDLVKTISELDDVEGRTGTKHEEVLVEGSYKEVASELKRLKRKLCAQEVKDSHEALEHLALRMLGSERDRIADDARRAAITAANREQARKELAQEAADEEDTDRADSAKSEPETHKRSVLKDVGVPVAAGSLVGAAFVLLTFLI